MRISFFALSVITSFSASGQLDFTLGAEIAPISMKISPIDHGAHTGYYLSDVYQQEQQFALTLVGSTKSLDLELGFVYARDSYDFTLTYSCSDGRFYYGIYHCGGKGASTAISNKLGLRIGFREFLFNSGFGFEQRFNVLNRLPQLKETEFNRTVRTWSPHPWGDSTDTYVEPISEHITFYTTVQAQLYLGIVQRFKVGSHLLQLKFGRTWMSRDFDKEYKTVAWQCGLLYGFGLKMKKQTE